LKDVHFKKLRESEELQKKTVPQSIWRNRMNMKLRKKLNLEEAC
jgi:hypothetical protein